MTKDSGKGFSEDERAAMTERAAELKKASARRGSAAEKTAAAAKDALDAIAAMSDEDRVIAERLHAIVAANAPALAARTWYGMPAYAKDGAVAVFFKAASKFKARYSEVGFNEPAQLDDGDMWPTAYAVTAMNDTVAEALTELVKRAAS